MFMKLPMVICVYDGAHVTFATTINGMILFKKFYMYLLPIKTP
jgi:hypothetical protein